MKENKLMRTNFRLRSNITVKNELYKRYICKSKMKTRHRTSMGTYYLKRESREVGGTVVVAASKIYKTRWLLHNKRIFRSSHTLCDTVMYSTGNAVGPQLYELSLAYADSTDTSLIIPFLTTTCPIIDPETPLYPDECFKYPVAYMGCPRTGYSTTIDFGDTQVHQRIDSSILYHHNALIRVDRAATLFENMSFFNWDMPALTDMGETRFTSADILNNPYLKVYCIKTTAKRLAQYLRRGKKRTVQTYIQILVNHPTTLQLPDQYLLTPHKETDSLLYYGGKYHYDYKSCADFLEETPYINEEDVPVLDRFITYMSSYNVIKASFPDSLTDKQRHVHTGTPIFEAIHPISSIDNACFAAGETRVVGQRICSKTSANHYTCLLSWDCLKDFWLAQRARRLADQDILLADQDIRWHTSDNLEQARDFYNTYKNLDESKHILLPTGLTVDVNEFFTGIKISSSAKYNFLSFKVHITGEEPQYSFYWLHTLPELSNEITKVALLEGNDIVIGAAMMDSIF